MVVMGSMAAGVSNHIVRSMHHSMERGMKLYLQDIQWKKVIDSLQFRMQCCGSYGHTDWHRIAWLSTYNVITSKLNKMKYEVSGQQIYIPGVPWSCCKRDYPMQCFHDPLQQYQYAKNWENLSTESVYNVGCIELLRQPIENSFLFFILTCFLLLILQVFLTIVSRYLYTSYKNAIIQGDPFGVAPGYLFGKNENFRRGRQASESILGSRRSYISIHEENSHTPRHTQQEHSDYDYRSMEE